MGIPRSAKRSVEIELYSYVAQVRYAPLVHCTTLVFNEPPRSNFACLAEKQAFRLGCAALSAPPLDLRVTVQDAANPFISAPKKEKYGTLKRVCRIL